MKSDPTSKTRELVARLGPAAAWRELRKRKNELGRDAALAWSWLWMLSEHPCGDESIPELVTILEAFGDDVALNNVACNQLLGFAEGRHGDDVVDDLDPAQVALTFARRGIAALSAEERSDPEIAGYLFSTYGNACRLAGPAFDDEAEAAYTRALTLRDNPWWRFNVGLLRKNRGRYREALDLFGDVHARVGDDEAVLWNIAICATGAGEGEAALSAWRSLGYDASLGDDGLPVVRGLGAVKVRLSTKVGERRFEHVWAEPVSPCHGRVLNPTYYDVDADVLDLVFWDGQPIGYAEHEGRRVPRFASLGRLRHGGARTFVFAALRSDREHLDRLAEALGQGITLYVFDDALEWVCSHCIRTGGPHRADHVSSSNRPASQLVHGKLVVPPDADPADVARRLDQALSERTSPWLAVPALYRALGDEARWKTHVRWLEALEREMVRA